MPTTAMFHGVQEPAPFSVVDVAEADDASSEATLLVVLITEAEAETEVLAAEDETLAVIVELLSVFVIAEFISIW